MADSPYPLTRQTFTVGDKRLVRLVRYRDGTTQLDPTPLTATATMQMLDGDGDRTGDALGAVTVSVIDDPDRDGHKCWQVRLDATGLDAGRYEWELHVSGADPNSEPLDLAPAGGTIVLVDRIPAVA